MASKIRDDFDPKTRSALAARANYRCSFRGCDCPTSGPSDESDMAVASIGVAAHIHGAAEGPGSRRYRQEMTSDERRHISNGIWLCSNHSILIDRDEVTYTPDVLRIMKEEHLHRVNLQLVAARSPSAATAAHSDLIAIGPDVICTGSPISGRKEEWHFAIEHFVQGDHHTLMQFIDEYDGRDPYDRYVLSNGWGDGRELVAPPTWQFVAGRLEIFCSIAAAFERTDANSLGKTMETNESGDIFSRFHDVAMVSGVASLPQVIKDKLSMLRGESPIYPKFGSRMAEYADLYGDSPWLSRLLKLDMIRMSCVPYHDPIQKMAYTPMQSVLQVKDVIVVGPAGRKNWQVFGFDLKVKGIGAWSGHVTIFVPTAEQTESAGKNRSSAQD